MSDGSEEDVGRAYDAIAPGYHLVHRDWRASVVAQGEALDAILASLLGDGPLRILDCSCGIGTQAIGLALRGHDVSGSDLSAAAVERAGVEAASFGVTLDLRVADLRRLTAAVTGEFDAVVSCDNSIAHLAPDELAPAFAEMRTLARPGGVVLVSLRDYDSLAVERPAVSSVSASGEPGTRTVTLQTWDWWPDGAGYDATLLFLAEAGGEWRTSSQSLRLHAHRREAVDAALERAGLASVVWHEPAARGYYQPLASARRA